MVLVWSASAAKCLKLAIFYQIIQLTSSAAILALFLSPSNSNHIIQMTIIAELVRRGHNVTTISSMRLRDSTLAASPNYRHLHLDVGDTSQWQAMHSTSLKNDDKTASRVLLRLPEILQLTSKRLTEVMKSDTVNELLGSNATFDLFVLGQLANDAPLGFAAHFRCPSILISCSFPMKYLRDIVGNPTAVATTPIFTRNHRLDDPPSFRQRVGLFVSATIEFVIVALADIFFNRPDYERFFPAARSYASLDEVRRNVSLVFYAQHFSQGVIRPSNPNMIGIGGVQIQPDANGLSDEIRSFVDGAEHGFILFSLGGNLRAAELDEATIRMFYDSFGRLEQRVIWKYESDRMPPGTPANVLMLKWLPQVNLLAQPNVRLFISHCGLGGLTEARYFGVPVLGLPIFGDQLANALEVELDGWGKAINIDSLTPHRLDELLAELLNNRSYSEQASYLSALYRDRPLTPLQEAIYWIEYVIRHNGAKHMQSAAVHFDILQKNSIDVILALAAVVYVSFKIIGLIAKRVRNN